MGEYCPDCGGVCASFDLFDWCQCDECPRCEELDRAAAARWRGITTINPQGGTA